MKIKTLHLLFLLLSISCKNISAPGNQVSIVAGNNVFGKVDKEAVTIEEIRNATKNQRGVKLIGKLRSPLGATCTASLVGKNLLLTAAHCVLKNGQIIKGDHYFYLGYDNGEYIDISKVSYIWTGGANPQAYSPGDWALLRLDTPLGEKHGYFGWKTSLRIYDEVMQAGYGRMFERGQRLTVNKSCNIRNLIDGGRIIYHDCDTSKGDSGSPIFVCDDEESSCRIVGLHVSEYRGSASDSITLPDYVINYTNVAISALNFSDKLFELK